MFKLTPLMNNLQAYHFRLHRHSVKFCFLQNIATEWSCSYAASKAVIFGHIFLLCAFQTDR